MDTARRDGEAEAPLLGARGEERFVAVRAGEEGRAVAAAQLAVARAVRTPLAIAEAALRGRCGERVGAGCARGVVGSTDGSGAVRLYGPARRLWRLSCAVFL